jgi:hypothetical protein
MLKKERVKSRPRFKTERGVIVKVKIQDKEKCVKTKI